MGPTLLILAGAAFIALLIFYYSIAWGFILQKFWYWFLLPVFPNLPAIDLWQAVGLMFVIGLFKSHTAARKLKDEVYKESVWEHILTSFLTPWLVLGCAALVRAIFM